MFAKTDKRRIYWLMDQFLSHNIDENVFSDEYYYCYDLEIDSTFLTDLEKELFRELSGVAARFSEFAEDHKNYPGVYYTVEELRKKVSETKRILFQSKPESSTMLYCIMYPLIMKLCQEGTVEAYGQIKQILLSYIKDNPSYIDARLQLIKHTYTTKRSTILEILGYIKELLKYNSNNIYALLYLAYIQTFEIGRIEENLFNKLNQYMSSDNEVMAMVAIAISWYYKKINQFDKQEEWLKKSVEYCNEIVRNYHELIIFYLEHGKKDKARQLIPLALNNVKHVFEENYLEDQYLIDTTNVEEFFNSCYKEVHVSQSFIDELISWINY